jgi:hypothetical protein
MDDLANIIADATGAPPVRNSYNISTSGTSTSTKQSPLETALQAEGVTGGKADLARSIYQQESGSGANTKTSNAGAVGGMQVTPGTFSDVADKGWDINDPVQNARAGIRYASQMYDKAGGDPKLAAAGYYGGAGGLAKAQQGIAVSDPRNPKAPNTLQYGDQVAGRMSGGYQVPQAFNADTVINALMGSPDAQAAAQPAQQPAPGAPKTSQQKAFADATDIKLPTQQDMEGGVNALGGAALHAASGIGASIIGGWHGLATLASGGSLEDAANAVNQEQQNRTYQAAPNTPAGKAIAALNSPYNPMNYIGEGANYVGGKVSELTHSPALGTAVNVGINAIPLVLGARAGLRSAATEGAGAGDLKSMPEQTSPGIGTAESYDVPTYLRKQQGLPVSEQAAPQPQPGTPQPRAIQTASNEPVVPVSSMPEAANETAVSKTPVLGEAQTSRAQVLKDVGIDTARQSALSGDAAAAATDYQLGKFNEPAGAAAKEQFAAEKNALQNYGEGIVKDTGGTIGLDQDTRLARGNTILQPLEGLKQWFDDNTSKLYAEAKERAQGQPVALNGVNEALAKKSSFSGNTDTLQLRNGVTDRMGELGMLDKEGNVVASTVEQAENLRKYLNEQWTPKNSRTISMLKDAIDNDVTSAAGQDIYQQARAMRAMRGVTLDDPNGISKVLDSNGPNGINRKVQTENVASEIASMPVGQFEHIVKTLQNVPPELQAQAQAALSEIKAHFANRIVDAGANTVGGKVRETWNQTGVNRVLTDNSAKLPIIFSDQELGKINNLRDAGNILSVDTAYPGAAAQAANAVKRGMMTKAISNVATLVGGGAGGLVGAPGFGAVAGRALGEKMAAGMGEGAALKRFQKSTVKLRDVSP